MVKPRGGMEFRPGRPIRLPAPPETLPATTLRLRCPERVEVVVGQVVRRGDHLIRPLRDSASCYVAPITGTVRRIEPCSDRSGSGPRAGYDVTIESASPNVPTALEVAPPRGRKLEAWFTTLRQVGPWNDRDGNVGLIPQLQAARSATVDTVICVGLDAFAPFPDRSSLLMSFPDDAVLGTLVLADLLGAKQVRMLAAKTAPVLGRLRPSCRNYRLRLVSQTNVYPSADPTLVLASQVRRRLPYGSNPVTQGAVLITPWTAIRIGRWYTLRKIDLLRPMFMAWPQGETPLSFRWAMPGQPLPTLDASLAPQEGASDQPWQILMGNPMTGRPASLQCADQSEPAEPVVPDDQHLITALGRTRPPQPEPCISCGWCVEVCPTALRPVHLMDLCRHRHDDEKLLDHLPWCIDCGLCSHVCPSSLPLAQTLRRTVMQMEQPQ